MASMDVFKSSAFSMTSLSGAVDKMDFVPGLLGSLNIFEPMPVRTRDVWIERRPGVNKVIPTSPIGAAPEEITVDLRDATPFRTQRLADAFTVYAEELNGIRAFGTETEAEQVQAMFLQRMAKVRAELDLTFENMRLGALQGILLDADDSVIYNYFTEFGESQASEIDFALTTATTNVRGKCQEVIRAMQRAAKGGFTPQTQVHALAGDTFYDNLINHDKVRDTFLNWSAAADLRQDLTFRAFPFGGITFHNYRGTDDNSTVAVAANEAKFFPVGAREIFKHVMGPSEFDDGVNRPGQSAYALTVLDTDRRAWTRGEVYSYPLFICQRPEVLQRAVGNT